ncbi:MULTISPECIES: flagellar hook assembly protein FlgD [Stappiaceae]|jgi:flagellar basal-body rod modification protein FlgD|uniref:Basal-body rod modification protein FlgD n=2 Tax=Roseibium TaxID=150830 RepID=A0A0M6Y095_9HYPH|nr:MULTISPECIES: flagellar hook assembly protein FlgD [Stappiaceae]MCR9282971.1 flagellar hook assembly protein FlgD [Paracoccaceae bacterium]MEC9422286.1 flagellar hook assembly protein FlgD [Pseudomonadota bacterium]AMN53374.1 flagellar basal body rod modification protein [Labrenzia sp. CP4]AQQ06590.1 flagellar basal body rod modification protein [Roseibium aggregatum]ERP97928.1 flagellar basal body rod modification protein FlgD [Labrenzia sp. C1B10]
MTSVEGVSATQGAASTASAQKQLTVDYDTFLHLMMAQMQNQDPTNPMDASEQLAQLASFSQVEQSIQTNAKLETLLTNLSFGQVDDLIGRTVTDANGTTGVVEKVEVYSDGTVLALDNGQGVLLGPGVTIS